MNLTQIYNLKSRTYSNKDRKQLKNLNKDKKKINLKADLKTYQGFVRKNK